jgi:hypothetical protein
MVIANDMLSSLLFMDGESTIVHLSKVDLYDTLINMHHDNNDTLLVCGNNDVVLTPILFSTANKAYIFQLVPSLTTMVH